MICLSGPSGPSSRPPGCPLCFPTPMKLYNPTPACTHPSLFYVSSSIYSSHSADETGATKLAEAARAAAEKTAADIAKATKDAAEKAAAAVEKGIKDAADAAQKLGNQVPIMVSATECLFS